MDVHVHLKVFQCAYNHYHEIKSDLCGREEDAVSRPGRLLPLDAEYITQNKIEKIDVWDKRCPDDYNDWNSVEEDGVWKEVKAEMIHNLNQPTDYEGFVEVCAKAESKKVRTNEELKTQYLLLTQFSKSKYPKKGGPSLLQYVWNWCTKLENVDLIDEEELIERLIFKLPFDVQLYLVYKRPQSKYALAHLLKYYEPQDDSPSPFKCGENEISDEETVSNVTNGAASHESDLPEQPSCSPKSDGLKETEEGGTKSNSSDGEASHESGLLEQPPCSHKPDEQKETQV